MAEFFDMESGERIDPLVFKGLLCKGCEQPLSNDDEIVDTYLGGMYAWSWHQACFDATGGVFTDGA